MGERRRVEIVRQDEVASTPRRTTAADGVPSVPMGGMYQRAAFRLPLNPSAAGPPENSKVGRLMTKQDAVAVVGLGCRYPDAPSPAALWDTVIGRRRAFRPVPPERLSASYIGSPDDVDRT